MSILIKNTRLNDTITDISVCGNRISRIAPSISGTFDTVIDGSGKLAVPPFYNTHTHTAMTLFRGIADNLELFDWLFNHIWPAEENLTEESVYWGSKLAILEMIRSGTDFFNDMYFYPQATIKAAEEKLYNRMQELKSKLATYQDLVQKVDKAIKRLEQTLKQAQTELQKAKDALSHAQMALSSCKHGTSQESAAASQVAKCNADVKMWEAKCKRLFEALQRYKETKSKLEETRDELIKIIRKLESDGQNVRKARDGWEEYRVNQAQRLCRSYPGR